MFARQNTKHVGQFIFPQRIWFSPKLHFSNADGYLGANVEDDSGRAEKQFRGHYIVFDRLDENKVFNATAVSELADTDLIRPPQTSIFAIGVGPMNLNRTFVFDLVGRTSQ